MIEHSQDTFIIHFSIFSFQSSINKEKAPPEGDALIDAAYASAFSA